MATRDGKHLALQLSYDGTAHAGWQRQRAGLDTVQGRLEEALAAIEGAPVRVRGAGRTDAGVHAATQVADFWLRARVPVERLPLALNRHLPDAIVARAVWEVPEDFHARFSATGKRYRYLIWTARTASPFLRRFTWHRPGPLDVEALQAAADRLKGTHDFRAFAAAGRPVRDAVRTIRDLQVQRRGPLLAFEIEADGFLYKMVRSIVGTLVKGLDPTVVLDSRDRRHGGPTAPPCGLCLIAVRYETRFALSAEAELDAPGGASLE